MSQEDPHYNFFNESAKIMCHAQVLLDAAPHIDQRSIEQCLAQLEAIHITQHNLEDPTLAIEEQEQLTQAVTYMIGQLEELSDDPTSIPAGPLHIYTSKHGQPAMALNLEHIIHLHDLGNSWTDIATVMGCSRQTIHNHLRCADIPSNCPVYTDISNEDLDSRVSAISQQHPFIGSTIMKGHLVTIGIHVSLCWVKESLKRVDPEAVLLQ